MIAARNWLRRTRNSRSRDGQQRRSSAEVRPGMDPRGLGLGQGGPAEPEELRQVSFSFLRVLLVPRTLSY